MEINEYIKQYKEKGGYIKALREHIGHAPIITIGVGVIVENNDGEILLQKRKDNGKWAIIGGGMEIGESFEEVIRREAREETGIELLTVFLNTVLLVGGLSATVCSVSGKSVTAVGCLFLQDSSRGGQGM